MPNLEPQEMIDNCKECFSHARQNIALGTKLLWEIKENELWKGDSESYSEFCEMTLGISKSFASKLTTNWNHYVIEGKLNEEQIAGIDSEKLYLATKLPESVELQLSIAAGNSRRDLNARLKNDGKQCEHLNEPIMICPDCGSRV
jgi:hypothetical protein